LSCFGHLWVLRRDWSAVTEIFHSVQSGQTACVHKRARVQPIH
jgi:hypothetical protein